MLQPRTLRASSCGVLLSMWQADGAAAAADIGLSEYVGGSRGSRGGRVAVNAPGGHLERLLDALARGSELGEILLVRYLIEPTEFGLLE